MAIQFGVGPELAAQCPRAPIPDGWRAWTEADGPIPEALLSRGQALIDDHTVALGSTESYPIPGTTVLIRVEPHVWGRDPNGNLIQGCFRSVGIYLPTGTPPVSEVVTPPSEEEGKLSKTIGVLTAVSLVVGTVATLATWGRS